MLVEQRLLKLVQLFADLLDAPTVLQEVPLHKYGVQAIVLKLIFVESINLFTNLPVYRRTVVLEVVHQRDKGMGVALFEAVIHHVERRALLAYQQYALPLGGVVGN